MKALGLVAAGLYAIHGVDLAVHGALYDLLWACHVGCLLVGVGCFASRRLPIAIGVTWLSVGFALWILDLSTGGTLSVTSIGTHVGGPVVGVVALRRLGWPRGTWYKAVVAQAALLVVTRALTPPAANVNLAFSVWQGWERHFSSYPLYLGMLAAASAASFFGVERAALALRDSQEGGKTGR